MRQSCIKKVPKRRITILREDFKVICDGCNASAMILSYFEYWHNIKIEQSKKSKQYNDVSEKHGDGRTQDETLFQFHTRDEIHKQMQGLIGIKKVDKAILLLLNKGVISIHKNPNPRYAFDNTKHYLLHPKKVNELIDTYFDIDGHIKQTVPNNECQTDKDHVVNLTTPSCQIDKTTMSNRQDHDVNLTTTIPITTSLTSTITTSLKEKNFIKKEIETDMELDDIHNKSVEQEKEISDRVKFGFMGEWVFPDGEPDRMSKDEIRDYFTDLRFQLKAKEKIGGKVAQLFFKNEIYAMLPGYKKTVLLLAFLHHRWTMEARNISSLAQLLGVVKDFNDKGYPILKIAVENAIKGGFTSMNFKIAEDQLEKVRLEKMKNPTNRSDEEETPNQNNGWTKMNGLTDEEINTGYFHSDRTYSKFCTKNRIKPYPIWKLYNLHLGSINSDEALEHKITAKWGDLYHIDVMYALRNGKQPPILAENTTPETPRLKNSVDNIISGLINKTA